MKKIIALSLALVMLLCCLAGCSSSDSKKGDELKADTVMTVDGVQVSWDEYMFWIGNYAAQYDSMYSMYGMQIDWSVPLNDGKTLAQTCVELGHDAIVKNEVIKAKCAEMGIELSDAEQKEIQQNIDEFRTSTGNDSATDAEFEEWLRENCYCTVEIMKDYYVINELTNKLFTELYGENGEKFGQDKVLEMAAEQGYTKANHILFMTIDKTTNEPLSDSEIAAKKVQAESLLAELNAIEDSGERYARFLELKEQYCEDNGTEAYQFTDGVMVPEFYQKSLELGEYELGIAETSYGYHLMIGLPLELDYQVSSNNASGTLCEVVLNEVFYKQIEEWIDAAEVKMIGEFKDFDFTSLFGDAGFEYQSWDDRSKAEKED